MVRLYSIILLLVAVIATPVSAAFQTAAKSALVIDLRTGTVLFEKDANMPLPPASMSKLMTLNMLFEALKDGRVGMETEFGISKKAHLMGGSKMFLREGSRVAVADLIPGIIVASGNDACIAVAEGLAGTEDAFARLMNQRAQSLGMNGSTFVNASGWPHPAHRMSARDLAFLGQRMINDFPEFYGYFSQDSFTWEGIKQANRNPLFGLGIGADGLKTGHTEEAGFGLVGSATVGTRRIVFVIAGLESAADRAREAEQMANWAFRQFVEKTLVEEGKEFARAPVWMGDVQDVGLVAPRDLVVLLPALGQETLDASINFRTPIEAPVAKGDVIGELVIARQGMADARLPLVADRDIERGGFVARLRSSTRILADRIGKKLGEFF